MSKLKLLAISAALAFSTTPLLSLACGPGHSAHMGAVLSVDASGKTFTIRDAETQAPITFLASNKIISGLKDAKGSVMVNYQKEKDGKLKATGVTF